MYKKYLNEAAGLNWFEKPQTGFITYKIEEGVLHIEDVYVTPSKRNNNSMRLMMQELISALGEEYFTWITISITPSYKGSEKIMKYLIKMDFSYNLEHSDLILLHTSKDNFMEKVWQTSNLNEI